MAARAQLCTACGQRWPQRDARFCGRCGAMLDGSDGARRPRGPRRAVAIASRVAGVLAVVAAIATVSTIDLSRAQPDTPVEVDDDLTPAGPPLSAAERTALREQADPRRLRCEPRGCELWRLDRREAAFGNGVVMREDGVLLGLRGYIPAVRDDEDDPVGGGRLLVAIDPATGDELWARRIATVGDAADWMQMIPAPDGGALIVSSAEVISVDDDGEVRWHWRPEPSDRHLDWWFSGIVADVLLLNNYDPYGEGADHTDGLTALDVTTGEPLWSQQIGAWVFGSMLIAVMDDEGLRAIHPRTGEVQWERPGEQLDWTGTGSDAPWVVTNGDATLHLLDPETGQELASLGGWFTSPLVPVGDLWVGVLRDEPQTLPAGDTLLQLVAIDANGSTVWTTPIGEVGWPPYDCCPIRAEPATGTFRLTDPTGQDLEYDAATGELVSVEEAPADSQGSDHHPLYDVWRPLPGVEAVWRDEGHRLDVRTADGAVTVTSGYGVQPESFEPLIVSDGRHLIGVQVVAQ